MDKNALLSASQGSESTDVEISVGTVKVRPMTRAEALSVARKELEVDKLEQIVLSKTMVDPEMTEDEIAEWQKVAPAGDIQKVFDTVVRISGMESDSAKSAYKSA